MEGAADKLDLTWLGCIAHFINLIVNDSIKEVPACKAIIKILGKFVKKVRKSGRLTRMLDELQLGDDPTCNPWRLILFVITRWNSIADMIER